MICVAGCVREVVGGKRLVALQVAELHSGRFASPEVWVVVHDPTNVLDRLGLVGVLMGWGCDDGNPISMDLAYGIAELLIR